MCKSIEVDLSIPPDVEKTTREKEACIYNVLYLHIFNIIMRIMCATEIARFVYDTHIIIIRNAYA